MKTGKKGLIISLFTLFLAMGACDENNGKDSLPDNEQPQEDNKPVVVVENCGNGIDDDGNDLIDCNDPACANASHCIFVPVEICGNGIDDDENGLTDCEDSACANLKECEKPVIKLPDEICDNEIDDDENGLIDCKDPACFGFAGCYSNKKREICDNEIDDDENGLVDCDDPACAHASKCLMLDGAPIDSEQDGVWILPLTQKPYTTLNRALKPTIGTKYISSDKVMELLSSRTLKAYEFEKFQQYGLGAKVVDGEPWQEHSELVSTTPQHTSNAKSLAWFWQISDPQLVDEESPCRLEGVYIWPFDIASAYRPQDHLSIHMMDVHIQTGMRISNLSSRPFDFILVTGDIADNAQRNELKWFQSMMAGGITDPDSGADDDPVEGPNNDFADPFYSPGVGDIPWFPAIGNHDLLYMGFGVINDDIRTTCTGDHVTNLVQYISDAIGLIAEHDNREGWRNGFRDASKPGAPIVTDTNVITPPDPDRLPLDKMESLQLYYDAPGMPVGHGLDPERIKTGWGYYSTKPIPDKPIRLITLDTNSGEMSEANLFEDQFQWLSAELDKAEAENELVIVQSHHGTSHLYGAVSQSRFRNLLASHPNVILHITGHGHYNHSEVFKTSDYNVTRHGYWEVMLASIIDFPSQTRLFELVWEGGNELSIYITNVDANAPSGSFVYDAVRYAAARLYFGFKGTSTADDPATVWENEKKHRNLILNVRIPEKVAENLAKYEWSDRIESIETLQSFEYNDPR